MKTIYLVRHAQAVPRQENLPDFERALVPKGLKQARRASLNLKQVGGRPGLLVSSPAQRALETAHVFADRLDYPIQKIVLQEKLYDARQTSELVDLIRGTDDTHDSLAVFGHDPSISELAAGLVAGLQQGLPKAAVVGIEFCAERWSGVAQGQGTLRYFDAPVSKTERARREKQVRKAVEERFSEHLGKALEELDAAEIQILQKRVRSVSRDLARHLMAVSGKRGHLQKQWTRLMLSAPAGESEA